VPCSNPQLERTKRSVFVKLSVSKLVANHSSALGISDASEARVPWVAEVHEPCVGAVAQHADGRPVWLVEPKFELWLGVKEVQRDPEVFYGVAWMLDTSEGHDWCHMRPNV
jgi:hypothetical protein